MPLFVSYYDAEHGIRIVFDAVVKRRDDFAFGKAQTVCRTQDFNQLNLILSKCLQFLGTGVDRQGLERSGRRRLESGRRLQKPVHRPAHPIHAAWINGRSVF